MREFKLYARGVILNEDKDKILVSKVFPKNKLSPGTKYVLPGGTVEFGEDIRNTLIREIREETNLIINPQELLFEETIIVGDTHWLGLYYACSVENILDLKNKEPDKAEFLGFISLEEFMQTDIVSKVKIIEYLNKRHATSLTK